MTAIQHRVQIETTPEALYNALTTQNGLCGWWTNTKTTGLVNSSARFSFGPNNDHHVDMQITKLTPHESIVWKCVAGPWEDTGPFEFTIRPEESGVTLLFSHSGWPQADEFYMHCNSKWGFFFTVSLKSFLETGVGQPHPHEPSI